MAPNAQAQTRDEDHDWSGIQIANNNNGLLPSDDYNNTHYFAVGDSLGGIISVWDSGGALATSVYGEITDVGGGHKFWYPNNSNGIAAGGIQVSAHNGDNQYSPMAATDSVGGFFAVWLDQNSSGYEDVFVQHIATSGYQSYGTSGINITTGLGTPGGPYYGYWITATDANHAIVVVSLNTSGTYGDVWAMGLDTTGVAWTKKMTYGSEFMDPYVVHDGNGGGIVGWTSRNASDFWDSVWYNDVSKTGNLMSSNDTTGLLVSFGDSSSILHPYGITDAYFGAKPIFVYYNILSTDYEVLAINFSSGGGNAWTSPTVLLHRDTAVAAPENSGGIYIASNASAYTVYDYCYEEYINSSGSIVNSNTVNSYVSLSNIRVHHPMITRDRNSANNNVLVSWLSSFSHTPDTVTLHAVKITNGGAALWGTGNGVEIFHPVLNPYIQTYLSYEYYLTNDSDTGAYLEFYRGGDNWTFAQHVRNDSIQWTSIPINYTVLLSESMSQATLVNDNGVGMGSHAEPLSVYFWTYTNPSNNVDVRCQIINPNGIKMNGYKGLEIPNSTNAIALEPSSANWIAPTTYAYQPDAVVDANGNICVVFEEYNTITTREDIEVELLTVASNYTAVVWHNVPITSANKSRFEPRVTLSHDIISNTDHFIVSWLEQNTLNAFAPNIYTVCAQSFNASTGAYDWAVNNVDLGTNCTGLAQSMNLSNPQLCSDDMGGGWVAWFNWSAGDTNIQVRHAAVYEPFEDCVPVCYAAPCKWMSGIHDQARADVDILSICDSLWLGPGIVRPYNDQEFTICKLATEIYSTCASGYAQYYAGSCAVAFTGMDTVGKWNNSAPYNQGYDIYYSYVGTQVANSLSLPQNSVDCMHYHNPCLTYDVTPWDSDQVSPVMEWSGTLPGYWNCNIAWSDKFPVPADYVVETNTVDVGGDLDWTSSVQLPGSPASGSTAAPVAIAQSVSGENFFCAYSYCNASNPVMQMLSADINDDISTGGTPLWIDTNISDYQSQKTYGTPNTFSHANLLSNLSGSDSDIIYLWLDDRDASLSTSNVCAYFTGRVSSGNLGYGGLAKQIAQDTIQNAIATPAGDMLFSAYPNPTASSTTFAFSLPADGIVKLSVYDLLGNEVLTLVNGELTAGIHSVAGNLNALNSGVYFCKLFSNGESLTKQITVMK